ncbi:class IV adenylate cyclase [Nocardia puris]|uniref:Adenylate cyclase class 2 n=1 Tax=Nocardia puris TaxID=208602 RepID=A0A366D0I7_9NOCA|nr:class IV adenylate cyclase [Nocardia puris]MBF6215173.1 class IV adenylate cyclase [Nocardia puris]MBF6369684.1 class IV adenylate cyclase [Nocardia puris]MBF6462498.1 class IV adenylate cyclase [Nocardia puris]RBO83587.1 adenylate cyclase class 2 [Nocardia puris]
MIEAEYKARLTTPDRVRAALHERATPATVSYQDTYYDTPARDLDRTGRELRLRTIEDTSGNRRQVLTFKDPAVDEATGSKPELETLVTDRDAIHEIIIRLGYQPALSFTKHCENFELTASGRRMLATIAEVPEIDGTFLELETQAEETDLPQAFAELRAILTELGVTPEELTTALYTDAVRQARQRSDVR